MATITFQMASAPLTGASTVTGTDTDMQDLLSWGKSFYASIINELFNPSNAPGFVPTNAQIGRAIHVGTVRYWNGEVINWKYTTSRDAVVPPPPPTWV